MAVDGAGLAGLLAGAAVLAAGLGGAIVAAFGAGAEGLGPPIVGLGVGEATCPPGEVFLAGPPIAGGAVFDTTAPPTVGVGLAALPLDVPLVAAQAPVDVMARARTASEAMLFMTSQRGRRRPVAPSITASVAVTDRCRVSLG